MLNYWRIAAVALITTSSALFTDVETGRQPGTYISCFVLFPINAIQQRQTCSRFSGFHLTEIQNFISATYLNTNLLLILLPSDSHQLSTAAMTQLGSQHPPIGFSVPGTSYTRTLLSISCFRTCNGPLAPRRQLLSMARFRT